MDRVLVCLATTRHSDELARAAVNEAKRIGAAISVLMVTETEELDRVYQLRSDPRLVGTRSLEDILGEIAEEHRRMLDEHARDIEAAAQQAGVTVERVLASGRYDTEVARVAAAGTYKVVYWLKQNRSFMARFFLGADQDEVVRVEPAR